MTRYVVSATGPQPTWVRWDQNSGLPRFTFSQPAGMELGDAYALRSRAAICCGGTLTLVEVED